MTSIVNTLEEDITTDPFRVELDETDNGRDDPVTIFSNAVAENSRRLSKLHEELRTDHLKSEERLSLIKICEEYNEVFYLPGGKTDLHHSSRTYHTHSNNRPHAGNKYQAL